jgi:hypothetical protein
VNGPDNPILIGSYVADSTFTLKNIVMKKIVRLTGQNRAAVTMYLLSLFWQDDFRQLAATVYQDVSNVVNKSPIRKNACMKTKKPA